MRSMNKNNILNFSNVWEYNLELKL